MKKKLLMGLAIWIMIVTLGSYANATTLRYTISVDINSNNPSQIISLDVWFDFDDSALNSDNNVSGTDFEPVSAIFSTWSVNGSSSQTWAMSFIDDNIRENSDGSIDIHNMIHPDNSEYTLYLSAGAVTDGTPGSSNVFDPISGWTGIATFNGRGYDATTTVSPIPEPATMLLFGLGLLGLAGVNRKK